MYSRKGQFSDGAAVRQLKSQAAKRLLQQALQAAVAYKGDQTSYEQVIAELHRLETAIQAENVNNLSRRHAETQFLVYAGATRSTQLTISGLLDWAQKNCDSYIADLARQPEQLAAAIATVDLPLVFVPPELQPVTSGTGENEFTEPRYEPRLAWVLQEIIGQEFNGRRINRDELIIYRGQLRDNMMRQEPYHVIEIPLLNVQIAVCDQYGEATFFSPQLLSTLEWATFGKEALVNQLGCTRIIMDSTWKAILQQKLNEAAIADFVPPALAAMQAVIQTRCQTATADRVPITDAMRAALLAQQERTGMKAITVITALSATCPIGLTLGIIDSWTLKRPNCNWATSTCQIDQWQAVMATYTKLPDAAPMMRITEAMRAALFAQQARTGLKAIAVITALGATCPTGLTAAIIKSWTLKRFSGNWKTSTCQTDHWQAMMEVYASTPQIVITDAMRAELLAQQKRTGVKAKAVIIALGKTCPTGLVGGTIKHWTTKKPNGNWESSICQTDQWQAVMQAYTKLPDASAIKKKLANALAP